jgi:hypothetical protein
MNENIFVDFQNQITKVKLEINNLEKMFSKIKKLNKQPIIASNTFVNIKNSHFKLNVVISKPLSNLLCCSPRVSRSVLTNNLVSYIKTNQNDLSLLKKELTLDDEQDISFYNLQKVIEKNIN